MPHYTTVLFDLDGTLIDSIGLIVESFHHTFAHFGRPPRSDAAWIETIGTPLRTAFAPHARDEAELDAMIDVYREYNIANHDARVRAYPGVPATVRGLMARGIKMGIVTSKNRTGTRRGLRAAGLEDAIETLVCAEDVTHAKPHREPVDRAIALLGADRAATLFVGDSVHDMHAGRSAEVKTGAAMWGPFERRQLEEAHPDHWLSAPEQVLRLALEGG
ncbi:Inorganic pyrophospatase PpaX [Minicystis rosea]|nr:Inorganic pyrophospatase PpaX [Minicystis rosea]